ncbi:Long-chain-fatty-acid--CoA ligase [plant metagenome]|uniref:Long-chain-fatty-acid--CoA ligase n=1 Tax=plant metagenome TaxID=1297885 RepID=A0A484SN61_9ZZZZ
MSIVNAVALTAARSAGHHIRYFRQGALVALSLSQLDVLAQRAARLLHDLGLRPGDRLGILARNGIEWVLLDLAAIKLGVVTAGFEWGKFPSVRPLLARYGLKAYYSDAPADNDAAQAAEGVNVRAALAALLEDESALHGAPDAGMPVMTYGPRDVTTLKFTSGSTGEPKGLAATVGSIDSSLYAAQSLFSHAAADSLLVFMPLSLLQQRYWIYSALVFGHDVTVAPFEFALEAARLVQPTVVMGVPGFYESLKRQAERQLGGATALAERRECLRGLLGSRVRYMWTGSAPANPDTLAFFNEADFPVYEGYGMNETCIVTKNGPGSARAGSVGRVMPNKRLRLDEQGVLIVGSDYPVNTRYAYCGEGDNEKTFLPGGEVRTGDLARIDEDGFLYILGRADDVIVLANGRNIHTRHVEERIKSHPEVAECVLFGAGRAYLVAVVSPAAGAPDVAAIQRHIQGVNEAASADERVVKSLILSEPITVDSGLLTSQFKPRRKEIFRTFRGQIENLYGAAS